MRKILIALMMLSLLTAFPVTAQETFRKILEKSPRHQEWVRIRQGDREVQLFVVYPEIKDKALAVIIIHEIRGLTDWERSVADRIAAAGYIAVAPDLLSGMGPGRGGTDAFADSDAARKAVSELHQEQVTSDLNAVTDYVKNLPAASGKAVVAGFCWGGKQSFDFASKRKDLAAAFVFYGTAPDTPEAVAGIKAPVYGFYGGDDARVNMTVPRTAALMKEAGKTFDAVTFEGAGHAFMRRGEEPDPVEANVKARDEAWARWSNLLRKVDVR